MDITEKIDSVLIEGEEDIRLISKIVYGTLMKNKQYPQMDMKKVEAPEVDAKRGWIYFIYDGIEYKIKIDINK